MWVKSVSIVTKRYKKNIFIVISLNGSVETGTDNKSGEKDQRDIEQAK